MKKRFPIVALALVCAMISGCASPAPSLSSSMEPSAPVSSETSPQSSSQDTSQEAEPAPTAPLLEMINQEHEAIVKPEVDYSGYINQFSGDSFDITPYQNGSGKVNGETPLTIEQVEEDLDVLFRTLQTTYGAYYHFGGDESFLKAKEAVMEGCRKASPLTGNTLISLLLDNLSFVRDGHFRIAGEPISNPLIAFFYRESAFEKTAEGYKTVTDQKQLASVEGYSNLDDLMKRTLIQDGTVVYYPAVFEEFKNNAEALPPDLLVHYTDGSTQTLKASPYQSTYVESDQPVALHENQGIPVLFVQNMGFDEAKDDIIGKEFLSYAEKLKDEPVVIIDLRSNGGGNGLLPFKWLADYTGAPVSTNYVTVKYWNEKDMIEYAKDTDNQYYTSYETMTKIGGYQPISDQYMATNTTPDIFADNKNLLIVLTGKNTASAAETFTDMAHNIRNTLVIGENTYGCLISNAYTVITLPNSLTPVQLGSDLSVFPEDQAYFQEFVGFQPDLWVSGEDAEELAVKLAQKLME